MSSGELSLNQLGNIYSILIDAWERHEETQADLADATHHFLKQYAKYPDQLVVETLTKGTYVYKIVITLARKDDYNGIAPALVKHDVKIHRYYGSDVLVLENDC